MRKPFASSSSCTRRARRSRAARPAARATQVGAFAFGALGLVACSGEGRPTGSFAVCPPFTLVAVDPPHDARDVPVNAKIDLTFSEAPDPDTAGLESIVLTTGPFRRTLATHVDLLEKRIRLTPTYDLPENLTHAVTVFENLRSLAGCPLEQEELRSFRTGAESVPVPPRPAPVPFARVLDVFARSCAGASCHRGEVGEPCHRPRPARGLDLCDDTAHAALVGRPAQGDATLRLVEPHGAARSYLVRKLLPGPLPGHGAPTTVGARMPYGRAPLPDADVRLISTWIDEGASSP